MLKSKILKLLFRLLHVNKIYFFTQFLINFQNILLLNFGIKFDLKNNVL